MVTKEESKSEATAVEDTKHLFQNCNISWTELQQRPATCPDYLRRILAVIRKLGNFFGVPEDLGSEEFGPFQNLNDC